MEPLVGDESLDLVEPSDRGVQNLVGTSDDDSLRDPCAPAMIWPRCCIHCVVDALVAASTIFEVEG